MIYYLKHASSLREKSRRQAKAKKRKCSERSLVKIKHNTSNTGSTETYQNINAKETRGNQKQSGSFRSAKTKTTGQIHQN